MKKVHHGVAKVSGFSIVGGIAILLGVTLSIVGGTLVATTHLASAASGNVWSTPQSIDPNVGGPTSVSCPSTTFCMAVDAYGYALE